MRLYKSDHCAELDSAFINQKDCVLHHRLTNPGGTLRQDLQDRESFY